MRHLPKNFNRPNYHEVFRVTWIENVASDGWIHAVEVGYILSRADSKHYLALCEQGRYAEARKFAREYGRADGG
jgi:hypothetical protein